MITSPKRPGPIVSSSDSWLGTTVGPWNNDLTSSQTSRSKPVVPTIVSTQVLALSALLPNSSPTSYKANSIGSPSKITPHGTSSAQMTSLTTSEATICTQVPSTKRSDSPTGVLSQKLPRLPQRPTTSEGQLSKTAVSQFGSVGDVQSGHTNRNNSATDFVPQGVDNHTKTRPFASSNNRSQRPTGQDDSILSNSLSNPPINSPPPDPPLCNQHTSLLVVESTTSSRFPSEDLMDAPNSDADKKLVHWPKQAPTVHWIISEEGS